MKISFKINMLTFFSYLVLLCFLLPVLSVIFFIFLPDQGSWTHLQQTVLSRYISNSLILLLGVGFLSTLIGITTAWLTVMYVFPGRNFFIWALSLPLAIPAYIVAYIYTDFLQFSGPVQTFLRHLTQTKLSWFPEIRSLGGAIFTLSLVLYPYIYLLACTAFKNHATKPWEMSRSLGQNFYTGFFRILLPLARPSIVAGLALVMMETLADFGAVSYFGVQTFTTGIYRAWFSLGDKTAAAQLSTFLLIFVLFILWIEQHSRRKARYYIQSPAKTPSPSPKPLRGTQAFFACSLCFFPVLLGFILPVLLLFFLTFGQSDAQFGLRYFILTRNSVLIAVLTAILAVFFAVLLNFSVRLHKKTSFLTHLAGMGYAVPGAVIAVGILIPLTAFDHLLVKWNMTHHLFFTGTVTALIFGYLVRFLSVPLKTVEAGFTNISPSLDDAARCLGTKPLQTAWQIHRPLLQGNLMAAGLMMFVEVMKELPITLIARPFNFDTLAVQAYQLASDERLAEASTASLTIILAGILPVVFLSKKLTISNRNDQKSFVHPVDSSHKH